MRGAGLGRAAVVSLRGAPGGPGQQRSVKQHFNVGTVPPNEAERNTRGTQMVLVVEDAHGCDIL